ncbi:MAG TPA: carbamoyltransferase [Candidatus Acidoferrales bacterium]|nr:carbamoyltransferase [Candidatus Acidoferrales bacterium]
MNILGISCFYHDAAAALVQDGKLVAAAQEERFTRKKHDQDFPKHAIDFCLKHAGAGPNDIDYVAFYDKPFIKFDRILQTYIATWPKGLLSFLKAMPVWIKEKIWIPQTIKSELDYEGEILFAEHHVSHAASAFLVSPFEEAAILTTDGVGEWDTTTYGIGRGNDVSLLKSIQFPHSLGLFYSAFTYYLGFKVNSAEYKVMGLAPYGEPRFYDLIMKELVTLDEDGSFHLNMRYFTYEYGLKMTGKNFSKLFGEPVREPESKLTQFHKDVAASLQKATDAIMVKMAQHVEQETRMKYLCMAGGVALNCVSNSKILESTSFHDIFVQPAAGDAGGAVGVAYYVNNTILGNPRTYVMNDVFLGPEFSDEQIENLLKSKNISYRKCDRHELLQETGRLIADQKVVGWFQGRMEFGPRALGNRSIIADARNPKNQSIVNLKIKFRESFRPFAPTILEDRMEEYFEFDRPGPFMLFVANVRPDKRVIPAVTHVDGSARLQTISREQNQLYYDLIAEFDRQTGCPVIINTSFNVRGEPIVCTPEDAWRCFMRTEMDCLVMGNFILEKGKLGSYREEVLEEKFELD